MTTNVSNEKVQFNIRLPQELLDQIAEYSKRNNRSKNNAARYLIEQALRQDAEAQR